MPKQLGPNSHVLVDYTSADDLEEVFSRSQSETMTEKRCCRIVSNPVQHTSMSVGDYLVDEDGSCCTVMPISFKRLEPEGVAVSTELALHLLALGLEASLGWTKLFTHEPTQLTFSIVQRLRTDVYGVATHAKRP